MDRLLTFGRDDPCDGTELLVLLGSSLVSAMELGGVFTRLGKVELAEAITLDSDPVSDSCVTLERAFSGILSTISCFQNSHKGINLSVCSNIPETILSLRDYHLMQSVR
jgi:hypothetical protein